MSSPNVFRSVVTMKKIELLCLIINQIYLTVVKLHHPTSLRIRLMMITDKLNRLFKNNLMNHKFGQNAKIKINDDACFFFIQD